jgi:hypothetical protein
MARRRAPLEVAAGKLISAIQREWGAGAGEESSGTSEEVMHTSHALLQAAKSGSLAGVLGTRTVVEFLGKQWVHAHPRVWPHIQVLEALALGEPGAS